MRKGLTLSVGALVLVSTAKAQAGVSVDVRINPGPSCPPPVVYGCDSVWVPATTQTVVQNTWHDPVTQDQVATVWVPDRYECRDVTTTDPYGRYVTVKQNVLVEPAHWQETHTPVVVRAGYWAPEAQNLVVIPGHWETVQRPAYVVVGPAYGPVYGPRPVMLPPPYYYGPRYDRGDRYHGRR